ncbi:MAG TPA: hypothetical protein VGO53_06495 [Steroidobacteraceae bacterium]|jgi:hypothetical protein|nr:hypothetical protein [Steroidobacteraceae bacterium]
MHTIKVIAGGLVLLAIFLLIGRSTSIGMAAMARWFIPVWLVGAGINMWLGVSKAGYSVAEEFPVLLVVFAVPAAIAALCWWRFSR